MHDALMVYFDGEKYGGLLLAGAGTAALAAAIILFRARVDFRSFAITLAVLALAEIALGVGLYVKTGPQVTGLIANLDADASRFQTEESVRMARVQRNFVMIEYIEVAIIIVSAIAAVAFKNRVGLAGVALGLLIHGGILLAFDVFAERRGAVYYDTVSAK